ncbi:hypothetical protein TPA0906_67050 [Streptomyces olivaceus]|uniref:hypothetical protein n=1 Tax=Streptomyces olivaceus TaxID=47716 RepID=UPI0022EE5EDD|nr:hypothetical protein [Streptomyces olivaceus]GHJ04840.1 hypothetical protein TPA0906_67050 [Streptomyces olivaceus]
MRTRTAATAALLLAAALTACSGSDEEPSASPETSPPSAPASSEAAAGQVEASPKFGTPAQTAGDGGTGVLEITPDTVVFVKEGGGEKAANGVFAVVATKDKAVGDVAADEPAPISGGGWKWMASDGEMIDAGGGNAFNVVMDKYNNADPVQPGAYQWRAQVFDLTPAQGKGGTLIYIDGENKAHRWQMPSTDSGPHVAEVKAQLAP